MLRRHPASCATRVFRALYPILALLLFSGVALHAQVIQTYDFENGNADGWGSFNGASAPASTTAAAFSGNSSLLTTTNSSGASSGPSISLSSVLQPGAKYTITGWVQLTPGEAATNANFTILRTGGTGCTCFDTVGNFKVAVTSSGWAQIGGSYTVPTTETGLLLYAQLVGPTSVQSFYLDDVVITQTAPPPGGTTIATYTWADGGLDGWFPFGSPTLQAVPPPVLDPKGNVNSLLTTGRTATFMGPALNLLTVPNVVAGATYQVSAYVMMAQPYSDSPTVTMSTKLADCATSGAFSNLATSGVLSNTAWTLVTGTFSFSNQPGPPSSLDLYFQSNSATDSFYISNVRIGEIAPPPPDPSQQDNSGISTDFEDGGTDGWTSRTGSSSVTNSTVVAHGGTHSLLTTGRVANYDGPQISVNNKMYQGSVYNLSAWVMMVPQDSATHVINMSLQVTLSGNTSFPSITGYPGVTVPDDGQWHHINVMGFNMANAYDQGQAFVYFQTVPPSGTDLASFYIDDFQLSYVAPPTIQADIPSIFQTLSPYFPVGMAVDPSDLTGPHEQLMTKHFNSMTSGNDMKWSSVENTKGNFNYTNADAQVGVAVCHDMLVRGHNLVWATGAQTPSYATGDGSNSPANQATVVANIQEHIQNEVTHFGKKVTVWDVVNEPLDPNQPDCLVHGPFYKVLGKSYIDVALQAARQYAPAGTKLFINDYSTADPNRLACLVQVVNDLQTRGIPLDGVGHEFHNAINYPSVAGMVNAVNTIAEDFPGIDQQVTEYDESVYNAGDNHSDYGNNLPPSVLAEQGWLYFDTFTAFKSLAGKIDRVTIWGMADDDTWLDSFPINRTDYPLPFDHGLQAKPAYWGIVDETQLPGYGMAITSSVGATTQDRRIITLTATNGNVGTAYAMQLSGITLTQLSGPSCTPQIQSPASFPVLLGDMAASASATTSVTLSIVGCNPNAQWQVTVPWVANTYENGTYTFQTDFNRGNGGH
ncbi:MAG TPA: endo-1,4-beta-xylanase [Terracidiphilus sp.]|nr:endo-1,4-beta-xylanase [Terracidiphilus sp.]